MVKTNFSKLFKSKGFYVTLSVCALAIAAMFGVVNYQTKKQDQELAKNAVGFEDVPEDGKNNTSDQYAAGDDTYMDYTDGYNADQVQDILDDIQKQAAKEKEEALAANSDEVTGKKDESGNQTSDSEDISDSSEATKVSFDGSACMTWPVNGNILMDYSMDTTVYYKTLEQYKCNPGVLIATDVDTTVHAAYAGTVEEVISDAVLGNVIRVDMGNGYEAFYGQMKDVAVNAGDAVAQGQMLGSVDKPTRYFGEEGTHLYFAVKKDEKPVDPKAFMAK